TVSFDTMGLIEVAVNQPTSGAPAGVTSAVSNSGQIQAHKVIMQAQTAKDLFKQAINQTGVVVATQMVEENGVIKILANNDVQVSGNLQATDGNITISS